MATKSFYNDKKLRTETGPGQYSPKVLSKSISYTMPGRTDPLSPRGNPGPGHYKDKEPTKNVPGSIVGKDRRDTSVDHKTIVSPGPGRYQQSLKG